MQSELTRCLTVHSLPNCVTWAYIVAFNIIIAVALNKSFRNIVVDENDS